MANPIDEIRAIDLTDYRRAQKMKFDARTADQDVEKALEDISRKPAAALLTRAQKILDPHIIEWHHGSRCLLVNHAEQTIRPHFTGVIRPKNPGFYKRWADVSIKFSITGTDMEDFDTVCRGLKKAADALAKAMFEKAGIIK
jgi:hypothetical protein